LSFPPALLLFATHAEVTVPLLADWEMDWKERWQQRPKTMLEVFNFQQQISAVTESNENADNGRDCLIKFD